MTAPAGKGKFIERARLRKVILAMGIWIALALAVRLVVQVLAADPANEHFQRTWDRTDDPVKSGIVGRTWMWGDGAFTGEMTEPYAENPNGQRQVQYFDKTRMEINNQAADSGSPWYVTNGLLVVELVTGQLQVGDVSFETHQPSSGNVAGDSDDPTGPNYQTIAGLRSAPPLADGEAITWRINRTGNVTNDPALASYGVTAAHRVTVPGIDHQVAAPFWEFMNSSGTVYEKGGYIDAALFLDPFYATGYPIIEAYWANVKVAGTYQDVLLQCFERRCLTYTPGNDSGWQVEAGNVGQHYYTWRYEEITAGTPGSGTPTEEPGVTTTPTGESGDPPGTPPVSPTETAEPTTTVEPTQETALSYVHSHQIGGPDDDVDLLAWPMRLASGPDGRIYVTDTWERILKFSTSGQLVNTFSRGGFSDVSGDVAADADGTVFHANYNGIDVFAVDGSLLRTWEVFGCSGDAERPTDVAVDPNGDVYVLAASIHRLFKFSSTGALLDQWGDPDCKASPIDGRFNYPEHVTTDSSGNVYVVDGGNNRTQKFSSTGSFVEEWTRSDDQFSHVEEIATDSNDVLHIAVYQASSCALCIQTYGTDGTFLGTWSTGGSGIGQFYHVSDLAIDSEGYVYLTDGNFNRILKLDSNANFVEEWVDFRRGRFPDPTLGMTLDADDNLYVVDDIFDRVQLFDTGGTYLRSFGEPGIGVGELDGAIDVAAEGDFVYVLDNRGNRVLKYRRDGGFVGQRSGAFSDVHGIEVDSQGTVYVADTNNHRIMRFDLNGSPLPAIGAGGDGDGQLEYPRGLAVHGDRIYVADTLNHRVQVFDLHGTYLDQWGGPGTGDRQFQHPSDIAVDANGYVYVADRNNHRIQKFTPEGGYLTKFGSEGLGPDDLLYPWRVSVASNGDVYVLDVQNQRVQVYRPVS